MILLLFSFYIYILYYFFYKFLIFLFYTFFLFYETFFYNFYSYINFINFNNFKIFKNLNYKSSYLSNSSTLFLNKYSNEETSETSRYLKFYNPVFKYDFKSGDYFPKLYKEVYGYLFLTMSEAAGSLRTAS